MPTITIKNNLTGREYPMDQQGFDSLPTEQKKCFTVLGIVEQHVIRQPRDEVRLPKVVERQKNKGTDAAQNGINTNE